MNYLPEKISVDALFGINTGENSLDLDAWKDEYSDDMPQNYLIIGISVQHGFIVLICGGDEPCVAYWDHSYYFDVSSDDSNLYFMADTFAEFIGNMNLN